MLKKSLLVLLIAAACTTVFAQQQLNGRTVITGTPEQIAFSKGSFYMAPQFSPDGRYLAFTNSSYKGINVKDLETGEIQRITDEDAAGFGFEWSPDSKSIVTRVAKFENTKRLNAVKLFEVQTGIEKTLIDFKTFMPGLPRWNADGTKVYLFDGRDLSVKEAGSIPSKIKSDRKIVYTKDDQIFIGESLNQFNSIKPFNNQQYLNVNVSPDGAKVAFEVYGGNLYVMNTDGTGLIDYGKGYRPQWSADGKYITYMVTEDDGHAYTSSEIFIADVNSGQKIQLTDTDGLLEMSPSWSPDGKAIVYHEMNEGVIYLLPVQIN